MILGTPLHFPMDILKISNSRNDAGHLLIRGQNLSHHIYLVVNSSKILFNNTAEYWPFPRTEYVKIYALTYPVSYGIFGIKKCEIYYNSISHTNKLYI